MKTIVQYLLGIILIISGSVKLIDPMGFAYKLEEYYSEEVLNIPFLLDFAEINGLMVSVAEVLLGVSIIVGWRITQTLVLSILMFVFFGFLTFYSAYYGKVSDCGCFGDAIKFSPWGSFFKDMILLNLTFVLWIKRKSIIEWKSSHIVVIIFTIASYGLAIYSEVKLPIIDFRPYKIGADIPELMKIPEGAEKDVYKDIWQYKVDGEVKEFTTEQKPWEIEGAEFVSRESILVKQGYQPLIQDFSLTNNDVDFTDSILSLDNVYCVFSSELNFIPEEKTRINSLLEKGNTVILISPEGDDRKVLEGLVKEVKIYSIDATVCKTVIRANNGVLQLKKGVVVDKYRL